MKSQHAVLIARYVALLPLCWLILAIGCGLLDPQLGLYERLNDRGPIAISADNPFLPANQLLSQEVESSPELKDFVEKHGSPPAIAVYKGLLERPELSFIYPKENRVYTLAKQLTGWNIGAPEKLSPSALAHLENQLSLGGINAGAAKTEEDGSLETSRASYGGQRTGSVAGLNRSRAAKIHFLKNGALAHTVTFPGESLSVISLWYTGTVQNLAKLAAQNGFKVNSQIRLGSQVIIPQSLLAKRTPLTQSDLIRILK